jgi:hypothetical protein
MLKREKCTFLPVMSCKLSYLAMDFGGFWMKPNFDEMSKAELKAYVLSHRDDDEAIRVLFSRRNPPDSEATWYGPMCTPEGVPIEENIRIAEEAILQRAERDREALLRSADREKQREKELQKERELEERLRQKIEQEVEERLRREIQQERVSSGEDNMTTVTPEEIEQFREQLRDYPEAMASLDVVEACEGDLERAARVLVRRAGAEDDRFVSNWLEQGLQQCRNTICEKELKDSLLPELLEAVKNSLAASSQPFLVALETPIALYIAKVGVNTFCKSPDSVLESQKRKFLRLDWAGGLADLKEQYTSLDLQKQALEGWINE